MISIKALMLLPLLALVYTYGLQTYETSTGTQVIQKAEQTYHTRIEIAHLGRD